MLSFSENSDICKLADGFVECGSIYNNEGETGSIETMYWNSTTMTIAIGYYKYREADDEEDPFPETFTYYKWTHVPTFREVFLQNISFVKEDYVDEAFTDTKKVLQDIHESIDCGKVPEFIWNF